MMQPVTKSCSSCLETRQRKTSQSHETPLPAPSTYARGAGAAWEPAAAAAAAR